MNQEVFYKRGITPGLFRKYLVERFGESSIDRLLPRLGEEARDMLTKPDPIRWYPLTLMKEFYDAVFDEFTSRDPDLLVSMGRFVADESARGFLRYLTRLISVPTLINRMGAFWKHYHKGGGIQVEMTRRDPDRHYGEVTIHRYPAGINGRKAMQGYIEATLVRAGAHDLQHERNKLPENS